MLEPAQNQAGFTLVEIILAMAIFSFGLLIIISGFLALIGFYQNGVQSRTVQLSARNALNQVVLAGRASEWFAYNGTTICLSSGTMFYLNSGTHQLMEASGWDNTTACPSPGSGGTTLTNTDAQVSDFIIEQADSYLPGGGLTPCNVNDCDPPSGVNKIASHRSLRVTIRVTSDITDLDPTTTPPNNSCKPSAPALCTITALSTTLTAGSI